MKTPENLKGFYLAFVLSKKSRAELLKSFPAQFSKVIAHHITIEFNLTKEKLDNLEPFLTKFTSFHPDKIRVYGIARGDGVECLGVDFDGLRDRSDGSFYHITLSVEPPHKPVESNTLKDKIAFVKGIFPIEGSFEFVKK